MGIYTPRPPVHRSRNKRGERKISRFFRELFRPKPKATRFPAQSLVTGTQRTWRLKRFSRSTVTLLTGLAALIGIGWVVLGFLSKSSVFRLTDIQIRGNHVTTQRYILDMAGMQQGVSLLHFDNKKAEAAIAAHPWVERADIAVQWPSSVLITIHEYRPFVLVNIEGAQDKRIRYMNRAGYLFADAEQGLDMDFPVITGAVGQRDVTGNTLVRGSLADTALSVLLLAAKGNAVLPIQAISEIHINPKEGLIIYLVDRPFPIYFGKDRLQTKYYRLVRVLDHLYNKKQIDAVKEIRMDYSDDKVLVTGAEIDG